MMKVLKITGLSLVLGAAMMSGAVAQSESDFVAAFSGNWQTLDPSLSDGGACRIELKKDKTGATYDLAAEHCGGDLAGIRSWGIVNSQLALLGKEDKILARMGGNQMRMSGDTESGKALVFERVNGSTAAAARPAVDAPCVYYGYTATCAKPEDFAEPKPAAPGEVAKASVLVRVNARAEARPDASVVSTIPADTCVVVDQCTTASDGLWCRAKVANYTGWIPQKAIRQGRWPVLTFTNQCHGAN
ncbi:SH3 domain-containing protein [Consotaella salsifontis]|uniref:SH3 domain-containing protein n=1 Tax=Consotaella salsifontis TaxID=1365950 RepID=A0A1T4SEV0_9HYPH|nr:AprI/Inh family metalloprotease inhibitor [Consotaella salsifontis]SKA26814.1 SH3 domain-containing protein [Consotaella salsifontis]